MPVDPNQDPDFIRSPYNNKSNPYSQTKLIKDLLKYSPDQLDNKEAELVNMIDSAINSNRNVSKYFFIFTELIFYYITYLIFALYYF